MAKVTVEIPDHLVDWFMSITSCCVEQVYMEAFADCDCKQGDYIDFRYPRGERKIVVAELDD